MDKSAKIIRSVASITVVVGALFKIQHWPGASLAITMGLSLMGVSFVITLIDYLKGDNDKDSDILDS